MGGDRLIDIHTFPPGELLPDFVLGSVRKLFTDSYYRYHYFRTLGDESRFRVVANDGYAIVGYGSATVAGNCAVLANLLVREDYRGLGLGRRLELARVEWVRAVGLRVYVSCTCEDEASQKLKLELGMIPVALKAGYRKDIARQGSRGSAVVFTDVVPSPETPVGTYMEDDEIGRVRYVTATPEAMLNRAESHEDEYVDILTGSAGAKMLLGEPKVHLAGVDRDHVSGVWHYCFQICNRAYFEGLAGRPMVVRSPVFCSVAVALKDVTS